MAKGNSLIEPPVYKSLNELMYRHSSHAFDDLLTFCICVCAQETMEDEYHETRRRYQPDEIEKFAHAMAELWMDYSEHVLPDGGWYDGLGRWFEANTGKFGRDALGQFFTPEPICEMMARILHSDALPERMMEPACGSGRFVLAFSRQSPAHQYTKFHCTDVDHRCVKMCVLNMVMHGLSGYVTWGDTLSMEKWRMYHVRSPLMGGGIRLIPIPKDEPKVLKPITFQQSERKNEAEQAFTQGTLF